MKAPFAIALVRLAILLGAVRSFSGFKVYEHHPTALTDTKDRLCKRW